MTQERFLILSDGKPGHVNQSVALARHLGYAYDLVPVDFTARPLKALTYLADRIGFYSPRLVDSNIPDKSYAAVVSTGSSTYYANKVVSRQLGVKALAIMLPRGYRYDFDLIIAQEHDNPPDRENLISLPINLTFVDPQGMVKPEPGAKYISLVIGGDSAHGTLDADWLRDQIRQILTLFPEYKVWMTTSRRTPETVEKMLREFRFERAVYYSQEPINPIPDFLQHSEYVFLTADSSSMISEAVSYGKSCVEVLHASKGSVIENKFSRMLSTLEKLNAIHLFKMNVGQANHKIPLDSILSGLKL